MCWMRTLAIDFCLMDQALRRRRALIRRFELARGAISGSRLINWVEAYYAVARRTGYDDAEEAGRRVEDLPVIVKAERSLVRSRR